MTFKWRVIKKALGNSGYDYIGIEFDMSTGEMKGVRLNSGETTVRMESTPQFEVCENGVWETISHKEAPGMIKEFNEERRKNNLSSIGEAEVLKLLYDIERMR